MSRYAQSANPSVRVDETHVSGADVLVDADLWGKDINPAEVLDETDDVLRGVTCRSELINTADVNK